MDKNWQDMFDNIKNDPESQKIKEDCTGFFQSLKNDSKEFNRQQAVKIERYVNQLASGDITEDQCKGFLQDIADLMTIKANEMEVSSKARTQTLQKQFVALVIGRVLPMIIKALAAAVF